MKDQAAVAHFPVLWTPKWSLSSRDKKRLKQILALCAAIIGLLWLLFQLGQYTVMGAGQPGYVHADGDRKMTVPAAAVVPHKIFARAAGIKDVAGIAPPLTGVRRLVPPAEGGGTNQAGPAPFSNPGTQNGAPGTSTTTDQQPPASGSNGDGPLLFGTANPPLPFIPYGGPGIITSGPNTGGNSTPGDTPNGGNPGGGPGNGPNGSNPGNGPSNSPNGGPGNGPGNSPNGGNPGGGPGDGPNDNNPDGGPGNPGNGPGGNGGPDVYPTLGDPPPFGNGPPSGDGGPTGTPGTGPTPDSTPNTDNGVVTPTVDVPEPGSLALFVGGLVLLLAASRRRPQKSRLALAAVAGIASLAITIGSASAESATVYGRTASIFTSNAGAFLPSNTNLVCFSMNEANCFDGKKWLRLYPSGRRHYVAAATDRVACSVVLAPSNDCWTGSVWYRLPKGQVFGVIGGFFSETPGAFITTPLRTPAVTYTATSLQSPLGQFATKR